MLKDQIQDKMIAALRAKNDLLLSTTRFILSKIKDLEINLRAQNKSLSDQDIILLLQALIKQRNDSIEMYKKGNRDDLVQKEQQEKDIIIQFLPQQIQGADLEKIIKETIKDINASSIKDMGKVMNVLKEKYAGQIDLGKASEFIRNHLT